MAQLSYFWGGTSVGDAVEAPYSDDEFSDFMSYILQAYRITQGVVYSERTGYNGMLAPSAPGGVVLRVATGIALVDGKVLINDANVDFNLNAAGFYRIVARKDFAAQEIRLTAIGPQAITPPAAVNTDGVTWDVSICTVESTGAILQNLIDVRVMAFPTAKASSGAIVSDHGGNARGAGAADLQQSRTAATQVASGARSAILAGQNNTASGANSVAAGAQTVASGDQANAEGSGSQATNTDAHAEGTYTVASGTSSHAEGNASEATAAEAHAEGNNCRATAIDSHAQGAASRATEPYADAAGLFGYADIDAAHATGIGWALGDAQYMRLVAKGVEDHSDATWRTLLAIASPLIIRSDTLWTFRILISGLTSGAPQRWSYEIYGSIVNDGGVVSLLASNVTAIYESDANYEAQVVAGGSLDLAIQVRNNGGTNYTVRWMATVFLSSVTWN